MTDEVVVGVDGSDRARTALAWGLQEARLRGGAVRPVTVWPEDGPPHAHDGGIGRPSVADFERDVRSRMSAEAAEVAAATGCEAVPVHPEVRYGQPAQQLIDTAGDDGLLVVGSRGRGGLRGAVLGSVSQQCAQYGRGPVVVVRDDSSHGAVLWQGAASRVVVGVDGSAGSVAALRFAAAETRLRGGELHVVHAWQAVPTARLKAFARAGFKRLGEERLEEGVKEVEKAGPSVAGAHLVEGRAADAILARFGHMPRDASQ